MLTTPDVVLDGDGFKAGESREGEEDSEGPLGAEGNRVEEGAEPCDDDVVIAEPVGIAEDPDEADVTNADDEPDEGVGVEVQTDEVSTAVDDLTEAGVAPTFSTTVNDPTEVGLHTYEVTTAANDLSEEDAALVDDDFKIASAGGVHIPDNQTGQEVGGGSLDDIDEAAYFASDVRDDGACMEKDFVVSVDGEPVQDEGQHMDVATDMLNAVETEILKSGNHAACEGTNINVQVETEDNNGAEGVGMIPAAVANEDKYLVEATITRGDSKVDDIGLTSSAATDDGIQTDGVVTMEDYNQQKGGATAVDDLTEVEGMRTDAVTMNGTMNDESNIDGENTTDETLDGAVGMVVPEEKVQMDEAGDDVPEEVVAQMDRDLTGTANEDEMEQEDPEEGTDGEDVAEEAVDGTVGDDAPEEQAAHENEEDDDDEPPPLLTKKGGGCRKRGRPSSKAQAVVKPSAKKKDEEEVCFICFDGGDLVICDRRSVLYSLFLYPNTEQLELVVDRDLISLSSFQGLSQSLSSFLR